MLRLLLALLCAGAATAQPRWVAVDGFGLSGGTYAGVASIEFNAQNPKTVWYGATKDRLYVSHDGGRSARYAGQIPIGPQRNGEPIGTLTALFVHPQDTLFMLAGSTFGAYLTRNGGQTWQYALPDTRVTLNGLSVAAEPGHPDTLYIALFENRDRSGVNFFRSTDRGRTWTERRIPMGQDGAGFCSVAAGGGGLLLAGANTRGGILRSTDYGDTWTTVHEVVGRGDAWDVPRATFAPQNSATAWGAVFGFLENGYLVRSRDGGQTWQTPPSLPALNPWAIEIDPLGRIFVGAWGPGSPGAYLSSDDGASWQSVPLPLRNPQNYAITWMVRSGPAGIFIGDEQYGAFRLEGLPTGTETPEAPPALLTLSAPAPNPARGDVTVTARTQVPGPVTVEAFDALGRRVAVLHDGPLADAALLTLPTAELPPGVYVLLARSADAQATARLMVAR